MAAMPGVDGRLSCQPGGPSRSTKPSVGKYLGMAYLPIEHCEVGTQLQAMYQYGASPWSRRRQPRHLRPRGFEDEGMRIVLRVKRVPARTCARAAHRRRAGAALRRRLGFTTSPHEVRCRSAVQIVAPRVVRSSSDGLLRHHDRGVVRYARRRRRRPSPTSSWCFHRRPRCTRASAPCDHHSSRAAGRSADEGLENELTLHVGRRPATRSVSVSTCAGNRSSTASRPSRSSRRSTRPARASTAPSRCTNWPRTSRARHLRGHLQAARLLPPWGRPPRTRVVERAKLDAARVLNKVKLHRPDEKISETVDARERAGSGSGCHLRPARGVRCLSRCSRS